MTAADGCPATLTSPRARIRMRAARAARLQLVQHPHRGRDDRHLHPFLRREFPDEIGMNQLGNAAGIQRDRLREADRGPSTLGSHSLRATAAVRNAPQQTFARGIQTFRRVCPFDQLIPTFVLAWPGPAIHEKPRDHAAISWDVIGSGGFTLVVPWPRERRVRRRARSPRGEGFRSPPCHMRGRREPRRSVAIRAHRP